ncbi:ATP-binding protein [Nitrosococcus wardiae]|uniref:histidine kinase n=1 Tax=Nitrosococcus wardiae TaxID=1814290 RepID=A0A4P7BY21_9GAMM|nr:ATP-binding protein [Nitrosococcus wardiae]QBQ55073.1 response regulator [Nitrosococcus wardiae]
MSQQRDDGFQQPNDRDFLAIDDLTLRFEEARETLQALRCGEVDGVVVRNGPHDHVFTLKPVDDFYRVLILLIEEMNEAALILGRDRIIHYTNRCFAELVYKQPSDVIGTPLERFLSLADQSRIGEMFQQANEGPVRSELVLRSADGEESICLISIKRLTVSGMTENYVASLTDVTALRRTQAALQIAHDDLEKQVQQRTQALAETNAALKAEIMQRRQLEEILQKKAKELSRQNHQKDVFLATLAHELRNPLAAISNMLQIMSVTRFDPDAIKEAHSGAERQLAHLVRLVDDLLDISRITRGKVELKKSPVTLQAVIESAIETSRHYIEAAEHQLVQHVPTEPIHLDADLTRLAQALSNVLINAAKYTKPGGRIELEVRREVSEALLEIKDNGIGIAQDDLPYLFDMFSQSSDHDSLKYSNYHGLGIGLSLTKALVELHHGTIQAFSGGRDQGSTFTIRLPLRSEYQADQKEANNTATGCEPNRETTQLRILIADDNGDVLESLASLLRVAGYNVSTVKGGGAAVEEAFRFCPHIAILDIGMPDMDGYAVAERFRQMPELKEIPIIALTGWSQEQDRERSRVAGFDHHLVKPVQWPVLERLLETIINAP